MYFRRTNLGGGGVETLLPEKGSNWERKQKQVKGEVETMQSQCSVYFKYYLYLPPFERFLLVARISS